MATRVHGGILTNQALTGKLTFYKIAGVDFSSYVSLGAYEIENFTYGLDFGNNPIPHVIDVDRPIPNSAAEIVYKLISQKATLVLFTVTGSGEIHMALENTSNGWTAATLEADIVALGATVGADDPTENQTYPGLDLTTATVAEVTFELA